METFNLPKDFLMGCSASAFQTEGWTGKEPHQRHFVDMMYKEDYDRWYQNIGPVQATDFYNRYEEDILLMKELGVKVYRTSIDWSRMVTNYETNEFSQDAIAFYHRVIDCLIENGIEPMICLEHWEIPEYLIETYGSWESRVVVEKFVNYAKAVMLEYSSKVKYWWSINEPAVVSGCGYMYGEMWPYLENAKLATQMNYHRVLATSQLVEWFKAEGLDGKLGIILDPAPAYPKSPLNDKDLLAAEVSDLFNYRLYSDPLINGSFSDRYFELLKKHDIMFDYLPEDFDVIKNNPIMNLGINYYRPTRVKQREAGWNPEKPFLPTYYYDSYFPRGTKINESRGWEIYPEGIYDLLKIVQNNYGNIECWVTENGMGIEHEYKNKVDGIVDDEYRIDYISSHLAYIVKAIDEGANCKGYMNWAFTDNLSPINAFKNRYGIVEIDLEDNRNRLVKKSGYWFKKVSESRQFESNARNKDYR